MPFEKGNTGNAKRQFKPGETGNPNGRPKGVPDLVDAVVEIMEGDGWAIIEGEVMDAETKKPTGQIVTVRAKMPTVAGAARAWASKVSKADPRLLEMYLNRTIGPVPLRTEHTGKDGGAIVLESSGLTIEEKRQLLELAEKAGANE